MMRLNNNFDEYVKKRYNVKEYMTFYRDSVVDIPKLLLEGNAKYGLYVIIFPNYLVLAFVYYKRLIDRILNKKFVRILEMIEFIDCVNFVAHGYNNMEEIYVLYLVNWKAHRDNDLPAKIFKSGTKYWIKNGLWHRDGDKPAIELNNGDKYWFQNGNFHRDNDKPAIIKTNGEQYWYQNGKLHRDNGNPAALYDKAEWYYHGNCYASIKFKK